MTVRGLSIYGSIALALGIFFGLALLLRSYLVLRYEPTVKLEPTGVVKKEAVLPDFGRLGALSKSGILGTAQVALIEAPLQGALGAAPADVTLLGTVVGAKGSGYAVFENAQTKKQEVIGIGQSVFNVGLLETVTQTFVTINARGRIIKLYTPDERPASRDRRASQTGAPGAQRRPQGAQQPIRPDAVQMTGGSEWVIDQEALKTVLGDMEKVLTDARLLPYSDGGKVIGFRITDVKPGGVFGLIGLQNNDILLKVNDFAVDSPEKGMQLLSGLKGETSLSLDILRNGQPRKMQYQIR